LEDLGFEAEGAGFGTRFLGADGFTATFAFLGSARLAAAGFETGLPGLRAGCLEIIFFAAAGFLAGFFFIIGMVSSLKSLISQFRLRCTFPLSYYKEGGKGTGAERWQRPLSKILN
jgi:hypothetical protein